MNQKTTSYIAHLSGGRQLVTDRDTAVGADRVNPPYHPHHHHTHTHAAPFSTFSPVTCSRTLLLSVSNMLEVDRSFKLVSETGMHRFRTAEEGGGQTTMMDATIGDLPTHTQYSDRSRRTNPTETVWREWSNQQVTERLIENRHI